MASSDLGWGAQISKYARELDLACLKVNEHLPPLGPDPTDRFEQTLPTTLLIREVYVKIYEYVKKTFLKGDFDAGRGLVVLGQPGIGKTAFLYYALVRALRDRIPVIWCRAEERSAWLQFDIEGKVTPYEASRRVRRLSFFDQCPPSSTSFDDPGYIVQATSPQRARYKDWAKQSVARYWVMENWSTEEVEQEAKHRKIDTSNESKTEWKNAYTPQEAFKVIGPSARHCFTSTPKVMEDAVADFGLEVIIGGLLGSEKNFELIVRLLTGCQLTDDVYPSGFHQIFFVKHVKSDNLPTRRDHLLYEITTPAHRKIVREKILETHMEMEVTTARLFTSCPSVAGYSYEAFAQRAFSHGTEPITIYCNSVSQLVTRPRTSSNFDPEIPSTIEVNTLYYPTILNFPSLDCFFVTENGDLIMLQVTVSTRHTNKDDGIKKVLKYIHSNTSSPRKLNFNFVYVVPFLSSGEKLVKPFIGGQRIVLGCTVRVGYTELRIGNKVDSILKNMIEKRSDDIAMDTGV